MGLSSLRQSKSLFIWDQTNIKFIFHPFKTYARGGRPFPLATGLPVTIISYF